MDFKNKKKMLKIALITQKSMTAKPLIDKNTQTNPQEDGVFFFSTYPQIR